MDSLSDMELPIPLLAMLGSLRSQFDILNWSIYPNKNQNTCVVIRFADTVGCTPVQYRRVSDKQAARSKARSDKHKQIHNTDTANKNSWKKRKCDQIQDCSPELSRVNSDVMEVCNIESPELPVKADTFERGQMEDLNIEFTPSSLSNNSETNTPEPPVTIPEPGYISDVYSRKNSMPDCTESANYVPLPSNSSQDNSALCASEAIIRCPCCDAHMDTLHMCDDGDSESSSDLQPPDDSDDAQIKHPTDIRTSTQIQSAPSIQLTPSIKPNPDPPDTNWETVFSAHADQTLQQFFLDLRHQST